MANKIGKYELVRKLATGGMAEVFLARFEWAHGLEKTVVVKRILYHLAEDPTFTEMFLTEGQLAARLSHPNIAQIIEFGVSEGIYFLAMEYIDGPSLRALVPPAGRAGEAGIPFAHVARIAAFCCEALTYAHELVDGATGNPLDLVHRDVSPDNILVSRAGSVKLVDFGIAKAASQKHQTKTGLVKGKLAYMAPEQLRGEPLDRRADVFSLGVVLYELIAGAIPYDAISEVTLIHAMLYEEKVPLRTRRKDVPPELERIVNRALERERDQRYPDCRAMHADLEEYLIANRQAVSALQIAQLVEKHVPAQSSADGAPPRAQVTPPANATAQIRPPRPRTGAHGEAPESPPAAPPPPLQASRPPMPQRREPRKPEVRSRMTMVLAAAVSVGLLPGAIVILRPQRPAPVERSERPQTVVPEKDAGSEATATAPSTPRPTAPPTMTSRLPRKTPHKGVELVLTSDPPGLLKVYVGGELYTNSPAPLSTYLPSGTILVETSGTVGDQSFYKRETVELDAAQKRVEHTIIVEREPVLIRSTPASHVTIDGAFRGDVPLQVRLYEGPHVLRFECDRSVPMCGGIADATQKITVQPGKRAEVVQRWQ